MPARLARAISAAGWHYCATIPAASPSEPDAFALVFTRGPSPALRLPRYAPEAPRLAALLSRYSARGPAFLPYPSAWLAPALTGRQIITAADLELNF